jgi:hypothetical protein
MAGRRAHLVRYSGTTGDAFVAPTGPGCRRFANIRGWSSNHLRTGRGLAVRPDTKQGFHFGTNFLLAPAVGYEPGALLQFQQTLAQTSAVVFDQTQRTPTGMAFVRQGPPLQVTVGLVGPGIGQLLIAAPQPSRPLISFIEDAEMIVQAYRRVWPGPIQIVRRDCTLRYLYAVREGHAMQYLWERRLHQTEDALSSLGRPVLGGGLRLVMPPRPHVPDDAGVEVKIESFLSDSRQLFLESQFVWETPAAPGAEPDPRPLIEAVDTFIDGPLTQFAAGDPRVPGGD